MLFKGEGGKGMAVSDIQRPHTTVKDWRSQQTEIISVTVVIDYSPIQN